MSSSYEWIRAGLYAIPFCSHIGLEPGEVSRGRAEVHLPERPHTLNHIGSQHGSAVFAAAEAASGGAVYATFGEAMAELTPLAERGDIRFTKRAEGPLDARATINGDPMELLRRVQKEGRLRFTVGVDVANNADEVVAEAVFHWYLRKRRETQLLRPEA